jgi:non-homologous end joining protein Ku
MEPFEINLVGQILTIQPRLDNAYDVFEGSEKLGVVLPVIINEETKWTSKELDDDYARQIGELIDEHKL